MTQDWEVKKLGEVLIIERGGSPRPIDNYITDSPDGINWIKISDATASDKYIYETKEKITAAGLNKTRLVNEGDFILSNSMSFGRPYIMKTTGCIHDGWLVLRKNDKKIFDTEFLYYLLSSPNVFNQFNYLAAGSTVRNLNIALVSSVQVPIPPLPEQQRIVSILDKAFAAIDKAKANTEQNLKNARELFESVLNNLIIDNGKWKVEKLGSVCEIKGRIGYRGYTVQDLVQKGVGAITLSPSNIKDNKFITDKCTYISWFKYEESPEIKVFEGDILFVKTGSTYGKVALVENLPEKATINPQFVVLKDIKCLNRFLYYALTTRTFKEKVESIVGGAATPTLSQTNLAEQTIPIPPLKEQQTIVQKLDNLSVETKKLESIYQKKIDDLEELKKSILQKAFSGEL